MNGALPLWPHLRPPSAAPLLTLPRHATLADQAIANLVAQEEGKVVGQALNDDDKFYRHVSGAKLVLGSLAQLCQQGARERDTMLETTTCVNDLFIVRVCAVGGVAVSRLACLASSCPSLCARQPRPT